MDGGCSQRRGAEASAAAAAAASATAQKTHAPSCSRRRLEEAWLNTEVATKRELTALREHIDFELVDNADEVRLGMFATACCALLTAIATVSMRIHHEARISRPHLGSHARISEAVVKRNHRERHPFPSPLDDALKPCSANAVNISCFMDVME